jgi:glycosyltransferase involved in cell wall biosynthesis
LRFARNRLARKQIAVLGLQVATHDEYPWRESTDRDGLLTTVFVGQEYSRLHRGQIAREVWNNLERIAPAVVVINGYQAPEALAAMRWCRLRNRSIVLASDSRRTDKDRTWARESLKRLLVGCCDAAFVAGAASARYMSDLGMPKTRVVTGYDCVDNDYFANASGQLRTAAARGGAFLAVSRLLPCKNIETLLDGYEKYCRLVGEHAWGLRIVGDGPLKQRLVQTVKAAALRNVQLLGSLQLEAVAEQYATSDCFVHPALQDTWALAVNEAMAAGLPVLVSRGAGCHEDLVEDGQNGWLFDPHDDNALAALLLRVHSLSETQRAEMARRSTTIIKRWGLPNFCDRLEEVAGMASERAKTRTATERWLRWAAIGTGLACTSTK